jgi:hypothetical protein
MKKKAMFYGLAFPYFPIWVPIWVKCLRLCGHCGCGQDFQPQIGVRKILFLKSITICKLGLFFQENSLYDSIASFQEIRDNILKVSHFFEKEKSE